MSIKSKSRTTTTTKRTAKTAGKGPTNADHAAKLREAGRRGHDAVLRLIAAVDRNERGQHASPSNMLRDMTAIVGALAEVDAVQAYMGSEVQS